jgi:D-aspartate ligase
MCGLDGAGYMGKMILQEFIPGGDDAMRVMNCYSDGSGKVRFMCLGQPVLEEYAPSTVGNYAAIVSRSDKEIYRQIENFLNAIGYVGFSNFDMKYDSRTGKYQLFEINARPGRSSFFVRAAGHNLMEYLTEDAVYQREQGETVYNETTALWTAVPKGILRRYVKDQSLKREVLALWKKGVSRTLFCREETSLKRRLSILRYYFSYYKNFRKYYFDKEDAVLRQSR